MRECAYRIKKIIEYNRLKCVEFHLTCLCCHGDGHIMAYYVKCHLGYNLRNDRIYLARHDWGAVLHCRKCDFTKAGLWSTGQYTKVIAHLGKIYSTCLEARRDSDKAIEIFCRIKQIICLYEWIPTDLCQCWNDVVKIILRSIYACSYSCCPHIDRIHLFFRLFYAVHITLYHCGICVEWLSESHRHSILQLRPSDFYHSVKFIRLFI